MISAAHLDRDAMIRTLSESVMHHEHVQPAPSAAAHSNSASVHAATDSAEIYSIAPAAGRATTWSQDRSARAFQTVAVEPSEVDADLYLFALCRHLQMISPDRPGIRCVLDAEGAGRLPEAVCRMLGFMVGELLFDTGDCSRPDTNRAPITVTLRRRGTVCLCTISGNCLTDSCECMQPGLQRVLRLEAELRGTCMVRRMPEREMIAIMFDVDLVEQCFSAAIRRYRWSA